MATVIKQCDNSTWVDSGIIGAQTIEYISGETLVAFAASIPPDASGAKRHTVNAQNPKLRYEGTETAFIRAAGAGTDNILQKSKVVITGEVVAETKPDVVPQ